MPKISQIKGMLLEESLLHLLRNSGYKTVESDIDDSTLHKGRSGMEIRGRGEYHQIDAIADYIASPAFCNPIRLLVEAKFTKKNTGLQVIRNAVGTLKDLQEYFVPTDEFEEIITRLRYHYAYSILSAKGYSKEAQRYAYAQDIFLIPFDRSRYYRPVLDSIDALEETDFTGSNTGTVIEFQLSELRSQIRASLKNSYVVNLFPNLESINVKLRTFINECTRINVAYLAIAGKSLPIVLVPNPEAQRDIVEVLRSGEHYRIQWDLENWRENGWTFRLGDTDLFSFDLPEEILKLNLIEGQMDERRAINTKREFLASMRIYVQQNNEMSVFSMRIDNGWIQAAIDQLNIREAWNRRMQRQIRNDDNV